MVCYVGFGVWFACSWNVVGNRVVDWLPADVACPASAAYMLAHAVLHGAGSLSHVITYLFHGYARCMKLFGQRREVLPSRLARVALLVRQEVIGESRFQGEIERFKLTHGRKAFAVLWLSTDPVNALSPVQVMLASGDDYVTCGWLPESPIVRPSMATQPTGSVPVTPGKLDDSNQHPRLGFTLARFPCTSARKIQDVRCRAPHRSPARN